jgi:hypothetical protein
MAVSNAVTDQFEAELHERDHKRISLTEDARSGVRQLHAGPTEASNDFPGGWEELKSEDKLGFARGMLWSLVFEAAVVIAVVVFWKVRHTR